MKPIGRYNPRPAKTYDPNSEPWLTLLELDAYADALAEQNSK